MIRNTLRRVGWNLRDTLFGDPRLLTLGVGVFTLFWGLVLWGRPDYLTSTTAGRALLRIVAVPEVWTALFCGSGLLLVAVLLGGHRPLWAVEAWQLVGAACGAFLVWLAAFIAVWQAAGAPFPPALDYFFGGFALGGLWAFRAWLLYALLLYRGRRERDRA